MPSQTFLNLPQEKQEKLINSAIKEFSRVSISDASINQIVKDADISRGSFYTYFKNKEDIFNYIVAISTKTISEKVSNALENIEDIFNMFQTLFSDISIFLSEAENKKFLKNAIKHFHFHFKHKGQEENNSIPFKPPRLRWVDYVFEKAVHLRKDNLNIEADEDIKIILDLLVSSLVFSITSCIFEERSIEEERKIYNRKIDLLKYGLKNKGGYTIYEKTF